MQVDHLKDMFKDLRPHVSPIYAKASANAQEGTTIETTLFSKPGTFCLQEKFYGKLSELQTSLKFLRAAATRDIFCDPAKTKAVIATCGGLVPGMNVVIRSIVKCLEQEYGVTDIHGARYGFSGLTKPENWRKLTSENLNGIQDKGGSVLGVAGPPASMEDVLQKLIENGIT